MEKVYKSPAPTRNLSHEELADLASKLAQRPPLWRNLVSHHPDHRVYERLYEDDQVSVWLICWMRDHDTGFHDHDLSAGAVAVVRGQVREERLALGGSPSVRTFGPGESFGFAASDIHRVLHEGTEPAVTIHAYSPPLARMGAYAIRPDGVLARHSVSPEEELRPLAAAAAQL